MAKRSDKSNLLSLNYIGAALIFLGTWVDAATVAYWRFEEGPLDANVARGGLPDGQYYPGVLDSSSTAYHLSAWSNGGFAGEIYRSMVAEPVVPLTGGVNNFSLQNTGNSPGMWTQTGAGIQTWKPTTWTVECWFRSTSINNWRVAVGRDGDNVGGRDDPPFRLMMTNASAVRVNFTDMAGVYHELNTSNGFIQANTWYHVAAVSDGTNFILYVNGNEERRVAMSGDTRLSDGSNGRAGDSDWAPGNWTVFRGMWNGDHADRWLGYIDEVRISDTALLPVDFLNSSISGFVSDPEDQQVWPPAGDPAVFSVTVAAPLGQTVTNVQWYKKAAGADPGVLIVDNDVKYDITWSQTDSALTINDIESADALLYYAKATFSNAAQKQSGSAALFVSTGLVHRWSFNGNLNDPIGDADGTLFDPTGHASYADGNTQLLLDNPNVVPNDAPNDIAYVTLPDGIISALVNYMTIELWYTPHRINGNWTSLYAFGVDNDGDPANFSGGLGLLMQQQVQTSGPGFTYQIGGTTRWTSSVVPTVEQEIMLTMVWNGNTGRGHFYVNGAEIDNDVLPGTLSVVNDVDNVIGTAWWNDLMLNASFNEMRIYDMPLPADIISEHYTIGPDLLEEVADIVITPAELVISEEGPTGGDVYFSLEYAPAGSVVVTVAEQAGRGQVSVNPSSLTFTTGDWSVPQPVHVTAVDDADVENAQETVLLAVTVTSASDENYDGLTVTPFVVKVADNECGAWGYAISDFNLDCVTDINDLIYFAEGWLSCSYPIQAGCTDYTQ